jgi:hypothetical protein
MFFISRFLTGFPNAQIKKFVQLDKIHVIDCVELTFRGLIFVRQVRA